MTWIEAIAPSPDASAWVPAVIECPTGAHYKYRLDEATGALRLQRALGAGLCYPASYGFIPRTIGGDGERLDVFVLAGEPLAARAIVRARVVGGFTTREGHEIEDRLVAVAIDDPEVGAITQLRDLAPEAWEPLAAFFVAYKAAEGTPISVDRWFGRAAARSIIERGLRDARRRRRA